MSVTEVVAIITAISALISAVAAAFWGKGIADAKSAQIEAMRIAQEQITKITVAQITNLEHEIGTYRELTPAKLREYFNSVKQQLEEYNEFLKGRLDEAQQLITSKDKQLEQLAGLQNVKGETLKDVSESLVETISSWSQALELRDLETEGKTKAIVELTTKFAQFCGITGEELENISRGVQLHDIGKLYIPDSILLKPGPLTEAEWRILKKHPVFAYQILSPIEYLKSALDIPYCHHEKWDGSGFPRGLVGEDIPLSARIFAIVDVFFSLTTDRKYRAAWPTEKALEYIHDQAGHHFDPQLAEAYMKFCYQPTMVAV